MPALAKMSAGEKERKEKKKKAQQLQLGVQTFSEMTRLTRAEAYSSGWHRIVQHIRPQTADLLLFCHLFSPPLPFLPLPR